MHARNEFLRDLSLVVTRATGQRQPTQYGRVGLQRQSRWQGRLNLSPASHVSRLPPQKAGTE